MELKNVSTNELIRELNRRGIEVIYKEKRKNYNLLGITAITSLLLSIIAVVKSLIS